MKEFELHSERTPLEVAYSYTSRQKAEFISEGAHTLNFVYGHDNHRRKTIYSNQDGIQLEKYFIGLYEKEVENNTIRHINYIMAGDGMTAIVVQEEERFATQGGENDENEPTTYYTYKDHLGSIVALTNEEGRVEMEQSFDAWGRYRNPQDWTYNNVEETPTWLRGYTGHEHLPHFDLINMNGRVYDPILGRMLSPDIYVQAPLFSQSYNRYSYCWNNPLRYTDPSGDFVGMIWQAGWTVGYAITYTIAGVNQPLRTAYQHGKALMGEVNNAMRLTVYQNENSHVSLGININSIGVDLNVTTNHNGFVTSSSVGIGTLSGPYASGYVGYQGEKFSAGVGGGVGANHKGWNVNTTFGKGYGAAYGRTYYSGEHTQIVGSGTILAPGGSFRLENDFLLFQENGEDRWRTQAAEITIGNFVIGSYIYTNDGKREGGKSVDRKSPLWGSNQSEYKAWENGQVYASPFWIGYKSGNSVSRIGMSLTVFQDAQQNWIHQSRVLHFGNQNYYLDYDNFYKGMYLYTGYNSPYTLFYGW